MRKERNGFMILLSNFSKFMFILLIFFFFGRKYQFFERMFLTRVFGRTLFAAARSEASAAGAAAASFSTASKHNPLEEFFDTTRSPDDEKPVVYGEFSFLSITL